MTLNKSVGLSAPCTTAATVSLPSQTSTSTAQNLLDSQDLQCALNNFADNDDSLPDYILAEIPETQLQDLQTQGFENVSINTNHYAQTMKWN